MKVIHKEEFEDELPKSQINNQDMTMTNLPLFDFYDCISKFGFLYNDENNLNDVTNGEKVTSFINYFIEEVHVKWMDKNQLKIK